MSKVEDFDEPPVSSNDVVKNNSDDGKSSRRFLIVLGVILLISAIVAIIIGLAVGLSQQTNTQTVPVIVITPELVGSDWNEILRRARGTTLNWWFWGLDQQINNFVNKTYALPLLKEFGITLNPVYLNATLYAVQQVQHEYAQGNLENGSVDLIWINGENFFTLKRANQLFGPVADKLPLSHHVDWSNSAIAYDFGEPVDYFESVWSKAQYQFVYLPSRTATNILPRSFEEWLAFARNHPGRLTYIFPNPGDFLAARFIKQALIEIAPPKYWEGSFDLAKYDTYAPILWQKLNDVKPYLWQNGNLYPDTFADQDYLFFTNEIDFTSTHDVAGAQTNINDGKYPVGSKAYIWHTYSIGDFNYVAIPGNAKNKAAALVLSNLILRADRQALQKIPSEGFGLGYGINYNSLDTSDQVVLDLADRLLGDSHVPADELAQYLVGDLNPNYHNAIVRDWLLFVGQNASAYKVNT